MKFVVSEHRLKDGTTFPVEINAVCFRHGEDRLVYDIARDVTKKSVMAEHLKIAQASVDKTSLSVFWINPEGMFVYVNDAACSSLGYSREELLRMGVWDVDPGTTKDERPGYWESYKKQAKGDGQNAQGQERQNHSGPGDSELFSAPGSGDRVRLYPGDISAFVQPEEQLKAAAVRLDEAQRIGGLGDWDWNPETDTVTWSNNFYALFGLQSDSPPPTYQGQLALYHPEDARRLDQAVKRALDHGEPYVLEMRLANAEHQVSHVEVRRRVERDELGKTTRLYGSVLDITERKRVENELKQKSALLEAILDNTPDIMSVKRPDLSVVRYNKARYAFLNKPQERVDDAKCYELIGRDTPCRPCATLEAVKTKQPAALEKYLPELDVHLDCRANPILSAEGDVEYTVELISDITQRKRMEAALRESEARFRNLFEYVPTVRSPRVQDGRYNALLE